MGRSARLIENIVDILSVDFSEQQRVAGVSPSESQTSQPLERRIRGKWRPPVRFVMLKFKRWFERNSKKLKWKLHPRKDNRFAFRDSSY